MEIDEHLKYTLYVIPSPTTISHPLTTVSF